MTVEWIMQLSDQTRNTSQCQMESRSTHRDEVRMCKVLTPLAIPLFGFYMFTGTASELR